jgi:hypothetical protein
MLQDKSDCELSLRDTYAMKLIAVAGLLLVLASHAAFAGSKTLELGQPVPTDRWIIVSPPVKFDPEVGRMVVASGTPKDKWEGDDFGDSDLMACEERLERLRKHSRDVYLDDPNSTNDLVYRKASRAECMETDGTDTFRYSPHD